MAKESDYGVKAAEWKLLDTGNPAFRPVGFADFGKNMQASFKIDPKESAEQYWRRVRTTLAEQRAMVTPMDGLALAIAASGMLRRC